MLQVQCFYFSVVAMHFQGLMYGLELLSGKFGHMFCCQETNRFSQKYMVALLGFVNQRAFALNKGKL